MDDLRQVLTDRLIKCGAEPSSLPGVLKALSKLISADPNIDPAAANARMGYLGWQEVQLDYHVLQLALACFELEHAGGKAPFIQDESRRQALRLRELEPSAVAASEP
jgi:hypothetical protein